MGHEPDPEPDPPATRGEVIPIPLHRAPVSDGLDADHARPPHITGRR